jgi:hypothetical protein
VRREAMPPHVVSAAALTDNELLACDLADRLREAPIGREEVGATVRQRLEQYARGE